ncbi:MAG TPA: hypothetical protein PK239_11720 [Chitinophagales bacterium]|nr:hypothetical protein [Chitinophagales bacterium]HRK27938.1 hypothetical protein [Chitinophagales bacterium]
MLPYPNTINHKLPITFSCLLPILLLLILGIGCRQTAGNKEQYLQEYRTLITEIDQQCGKSTLLPNAEYWKTTDEKMYQYSGELYRLFYPLLNFKEKAEIGKFPVIYHLCRYKAVVNEQVNFEFKGEVETLVKSLQEMIDSTANIYNGYDAGIRNRLHEFRSRQIPR